MKWLEQAKPCKIGTVPMVVQVHGSDWYRLDKMVGREIRVRYCAGGRWEKVRVTRVDHDRYFTADK